MVLNSTTHLILILVVICWIIAYYQCQREDLKFLEPECTKPIGSNPPLVSIIIPARDEENNLPVCLASLAKINYPAYEVIVIDDHSTDRTYNIAKSFAKDNTNFKAIQSKDLPSGWTGKNWANYQGVQKCKGEWLLFTDADTEFFPHALAAAFAYVQKENLDMLSLMPQAKMTNFWDKITLPIIGGGIMALCPPPKVNNPRSRVAAAIGAFIMVKRKVYDAVGGHRSIRGKIVDDREFAILVKSSGYKYHLLNGAGIYRVLMYDNFKDLWEGWGKNLFLGMDCSYFKVFGAIIGIFSLMIFPFLAMVWCLISYSERLGPCLEIIAANLIIMWIYIRLLRMYKCDLPAIYGVSLPLGGTIVIGIIVNSVFRYHRGISWRGRKYSKTSVDV